METLSRAVFDLSHSMVENMIKNQKNILISPCSIYVALKMLYVGAQGKTKEQIEKVLKVSKEEGTPSKDLKELLMNMLCSTSYEMTLANALFPDKTFTLKKEYTDDLTTKFNAKAEVVDFKNNAEPARQLINKWVSDTTKGKIKDFLAQGSLDASTRMVLVNGVYFKGLWEQMFDTANTKTADFHISKTEKKPVEMMHQGAKFKFAENAEKKCKVLELPYEGDVALIVVIPDNIEGVQKLHSSMPPEEVITWMKSGNLQERDIDLSFPKMNMEGDYDLIPVMQELQITDLFDDSADLSGMSDEKGLKISVLIHKTYLEADEKGTVAAGATGGAISVTSLPMRQEVKVDRPFIFYLIHKKLSLVLFKGVFCTP